MSHQPVSAPVLDLDMFENYSISTFIYGLTTHNKVKLQTTDGSSLPTWAENLGLVG
jgi:hypothetical protein